MSLCPTFWLFLLSHPPHSTVLVASSTIFFKASQEQCSLKNEKKLGNYLHCVPTWTVPAGSHDVESISGEDLCTAGKKWLEQLHREKKKTGGSFCLHMNISIFYLYSCSQTITQIGNCSSEEDTCIIWQQARSPAPNWWDNIILI